MKCNCGVIFVREIKYHDHGQYCRKVGRKFDVLMRWKSEKCDSCVEKRVDKALENMPKIIGALSLSTENCSVSVDGYQKSGIKNK